MKALNNRHTVAFFTPEYESDYSRLLCQGALDSAEEHDANIFLFPGKAINSPYQYQHQYNVIYELVDTENVNGLIVPLSIFHAFTTREEIELFCNKYRPLPLVTVNIPVNGHSCICVDNKTGLHELLNHMIHHHGKTKIAYIQGTENNLDAEERYTVYREVLEDNGLVFDPELVCPGDFTALSVSKAIELLLDERNAQFDTLLAANDEMALAALRILGEKGVRVPENMAVIGFDDVDACRLSNPPLTTVKQPIYEIGYTAVTQLLDQINGGKSGSIMLPSEAVYRKSCGCKESGIVNFDEVRSKKSTSSATASEKSPVVTTHKVVRRNILLRSIEAIFENIVNPQGIISESKNLDQQFAGIFERMAVDESDVQYIQDLLTKLRTRYLEHADNREQVITITNLFDQARVIVTERVQVQNVMIWAEHDMAFRHLRGVIYSMFPYVENRQFSVAAASANPLKLLGLRSCFIYLYDDEIFCSRKHRWQMPAHLSLAMAYSDEHVNPVYRESGRTAIKQILCNKYLPVKRRYSFMVNPLFFLDYQMGFIICDLNLKDRFMYESLFVEMGCLLKFSYIVMTKRLFEDKLRNALLELEEHDGMLNMVKQTDDLTGLYNREGFIHMTRQRMQAIIKRKSHGLLFYAELSEYNSILEKYRRDECDHIIREAGIILKRTFRNDDILARLGEDKFVVFTDDVLSDVMDSVVNRLNSLLDEYNARSKKPHTLSIVIGVLEYPHHNEKSIEELLIEVEDRLHLNT
jgi:diguanylate cyclase (GGDEF)-like protein